MRLLPAAPRSAWLRALTLVPAGLQKPPSCWAVLTQDRVTIVLLAVGQDLYLLDNTSCSVVVSEPWRHQWGAGRSAAPSASWQVLPPHPGQGQSCGDKADTAWEGTVTLWPALGPLCSTGAGT